MVSMSQGVFGNDYKRLTEELKSQITELSKRNEALKAEIIKKKELNSNAFICDEQVNFNPVRAEIPHNARLYLAKKDGKYIKNNRGERLYLLSFPLEGNKLWESILEFSRNHQYGQIIIDLQRHLLIEFFALNYFKLHAFTPTELASEDDTKIDKFLCEHIKNSELKAMYQKGLYKEILDKIINKLDKEKKFITPQGKQQVQTYFKGIEEVYGQDSYHKIIIELLRLKTVEKHYSTSTELQLCPKYRFYEQVTDNRENTFNYATVAAYLDPQKKIIAAIHAGWKGLKKGILNKFFENKKYLTKNIKVSIGPHARNCCYKVTEEMKYIFPNHVKNTNSQYYMDMTRFVTDYLDQLSIEYEDCGFCTICNDNFYSYRRDGTHKRQYSFVCL